MTNPNTPIYREPKVKSILGISEQFNLTASDIEHRGKSFTDEKTLKLGGIRRVSDDVGHQILNIDTRKKDVDYNGLAIPYFNIWNSNAILEYNLRLDKPGYDIGGDGNRKEKPKYRKPRTTKNLLYVPPMVKAEWLKDKKKKIIVATEGEFKALALARAASNDFTSEDLPFIPVAISGVDNFKTKAIETLDTGEKIQVSAGLLEFEKIEWKNTVVIVCFDSDIDEKQNVKGARSRINRFFREKKVKVFNLDFPKEFEGIPTKGIDDYLGAIESKYDTQTAIDAALELVEEAQKPKKTKSPIADNFELIEDGRGESPGVYYTDEDGTSFKVCSPLRIVAVTETKDGEKCGRLLEWRDGQNRLHTWAMPIELVHSEGAELAKYLASNGLEIMPSRKHREKLNFYIATSKAEKISISTDKIGWHDGCFVLPGETFGSCENEIVYQTEYAGHHNFNNSGALNEWQENISHFCSNNSRLLFSVAAAFSAPLLFIVQTQGIGFHLRGSTSTGKTTALLTGGSVWGGDGERGFLQTWKATANGLEIIAAGHNHALLCLDEIGECEAREIGNVAYMLANGSGKLRMQKTLQARKSLAWNLFFLSTGEQSLSDKMTEAGQTVKGGQEIRLCDIEADTGKFGLFEDLHRFKSGTAFSDHLRAAARKYYGTPIREFLTYLTEIDHSDIRTRWHGFKAKFVSDVLPAQENEDVPGEVFRVAEQFALIAFGGELATDASVTKWQPLEAYEAVKKVFLQWMGGREGTGQSDAENAIRQVRAFLEKNGASAFQDVAFPDQKVINRAGFIKKNAVTDKTEYLIMPEAFRRDVCKGLNYKFVAKVLNNRGYLEVQDEKTLSKNFYLSKELGKMRVYVVRDMLTETESEKSASV
jgi:putative DNA primase/helicase